MPRVMLVYHNPLFAHSLRTALRDQPHLIIVGEVDDWTRAEAEIARLNPDVVLLEEENREAAERTLHALSTRDQPWRVVAMRLDETTMHIWSGTWQPITRTQDLLDVLTQPPFENSTRDHK